MVYKFYCKIINNFHTDKRKMILYNFDYYSYSRNVIFNFRLFEFSHDFEKVLVNCYFY